MVIKKPDGSQFDVEGKLYDEVKLTMVIDGYNAPLTGNLLIFIFIVLHEYSCSIYYLLYPSYFHLITRWKLR